MNISIKTHSLERVVQQDTCFCMSIFPFTYTPYMPSSLTFCEWDAFSVSRKQSKKKRFFLFVALSIFLFLTPLSAIHAHQESRKTIKGYIDAFFGSVFTTYREDAKEEIGKNIREGTPEKEIHSEKAIEIQDYLTNIVSIAPATLSAHAASALHGVSLTATLFSDTTHDILNNTIEYVRWGIDTTTGALVYHIFYKEDNKEKITSALFSFNGLLKNISLTISNAYTTFGQFFVSEVDVTLNNAVRFTDKVIDTTTGALVYHTRRGIEKGLSVLVDGGVASVSAFENFTATASTPIDTFNTNALNFFCKTNSLLGGSACEKKPFPK